VLASGGNLGIGTTTPGYLLHVNGTMRAETGLSLGGNAVLSVDAPGVPGGQFQVSNGKVSIGGDTPMSSNPRMTFSGALLMSFCGDATCGCSIGCDPTPTPSGYFVPDRNITVTRMSVSLGNAVDPSCSQLPEIILGTGGVFWTALYTLHIPANTRQIDSGPISVNVDSGTGVWFTGGGTGGCTLGSSGGGNAFINVQYVMR